ncbi:hypothetical protein NQ176_g2517 [Zarea fungicola]|uniref:Uncharacterized protein n=1 Tax=Zarea fungicola TaxID=93591 RepID=A0ACC1NQL5_9HYPO|nr:hypothetical protein NQ176_g2517 [Lecanicillium fungicola]
MLASPLGALHMRNDAQDHVFSGCGPCDLALIALAGASHCPVAGRQGMSFSAFHSAFDAVLTNHSGVSFPPYNLFIILPQSTMPDILQFIRRKRHAKKKDKDGFPYLPDVPSATSFAPSTIALPESNADCLLFQKLPWELRRRILMEAFGQRTIHMNLALEVTLGENRHIITTELRKRHAATPRPRHGDETLPREWKWRSSVCHGPCFDHRYWSMKPPRGPGPREREDACLEGDAMCEYLTDQPLPFACFIGVLGWLLTCRQAYSEGIEILYRTNTIRLHGTHIFSNLPKLVPQARLNDITAVSLFWDIGAPGFCGKYRLPQNFIGLDGLETLLCKLPTTLPNVKRLHLSLFGFWWQDLQLRAAGRRSREMYDATESLLRTIMSTALQLQSLDDCRISLPVSIYQPWALEATDKIELQSEALKEAPPSLWRHLPEDAALSGYWVQNGVQDLPKEQQFGNY